MKVAIVVVGLLLLVVAAIVAARRKPRAVDKSAATFAGPVAQYRGRKKLVVAFTASRATVWKVTEAELRNIDRDKFDLCILDMAVDAEQIRAFDVRFLPAVALVEDGKITKRVQNLANIEQLHDW